MDDEKRIEMYYRFGVSDWKSEQYESKMKTQKKGGKNRTISDGHFSLKCMDYIKKFLNIL